MQEENTKTKSNGRTEQITQNLVETMISFNEILMRVQEEQNQINNSIFQSLIDMQQRINLGSNPSNVVIQEGRNAESFSRGCSRKRTLSPRKSSMSRKRRTTSSRYSSSRSCDSRGCRSSPKNNSSRFEGRQKFKRVSEGEFRKARPPTFHRESKTSQEVDTWLLGMKKLIQNS